ncbi:MAG: BatA domain-containing protein [Phycisphaerales bacterium]|nr:BatA domain-containing protein [Phycisphaerales bacterium]
MTFITPALLVAGLLAVAVPILIHLLSRQRRRPIPWAAMRFLLEAIRRQRRRLQIEQILLLAVRCLILAVLGFALARPLIERTGLLDAGGNRTVYLVIDNGLASGALDDDGTAALERHVAAATGIVRALDAGDVVGVITAARPARGVLVPPSSDLDGVVRLLDGLKPSAAPSDIGGALAIAGEVLDQVEASAARGAVYLLSDFRTGSVALDEPLPRTLRDIPERIALIATSPAETLAPNVQIVAIEPLRRFVLSGASDVSSQVTVRLRRTGSDLAREVTRVSLSGNGVSAGDAKVVLWEPGQSAASIDFIVRYAEQGRGELGLVATIESDALDADNERQSVLALRDRIRAVLVDRRTFGFDPSLEAMSAGQWIRRALEPSDDSPFELVQVEPETLDLADLRVADVVILPRPDLVTETGWPMLKAFVDRGGLLFVTPPGETNVHQWVDHLGRDLDLPWGIGIETIDAPGGLALSGEQPASELLRMIAGDLKDLVAPVVTTRRLVIDGEQTQASRVVLFADGSPFMIAGAPGLAESERDGSRSRGLVLFIAAAPQLSWTNLPSKPFMVPLFHESIRQGLSLVRGSGDGVLGRGGALTVAPGAAELRAESGVGVALDATGRPERELDESGLYEVRDVAGQPIGLLAMNVDPEGARTDPQSEASILEWLATSGAWTTASGDGLASVLRDVAGASPLAGMALWIVLALVLIETVLARRFSHAYRQSGRPRLGASAGVTTRPRLGPTMSATRGGAA